jgi:hydroxyacid-oxoacid transhydrogenase
MLGADTRHASLDDAGEVLAQALIGIMKRVEMPNGIAAVGYTEADIPALVEKAIPQHRVTKLSPRPATPEDLAELFRGAMRYW